MQAVQALLGGLVWREPLAHPEKGAGAPLTALTKHPMRWEWIIDESQSAFCHSLCGVLGPLLLFHQATSKVSCVRRCVLLCIAPFRTAVLLRSTDPYRRPCVNSKHLPIVRDPLQHTSASPARREKDDETIERSKGRKRNTNRSSPFCKEGRGSRKVGKLSD